ncbi:EAL domain-containing protein [Pseudomonas sp. URMO17WK12:I12]|jgi:EAL domain-containing protein (putative c-di-GMP-specific phosphodiesterase class I)/CheY-like chemotaxis protein|uniref:EAL domain-containing response regulator n=1 Tax=Pseudomonas sp. URMO17WK12:I12 TaxID=1259797 RepID=UPI0004AFC2FB|nr:EAL domain-containing response regulator [Pseudomonas sp. URMO17WK12:I12]
MQTGKVILLEDNRFQRAVLRATLGLIGVTDALEAGDGAEALALLRACGGVRLVICDLQMAGMDGLAFLRRAAQERLVEAVIICSDIEPSLRCGVAAMVAGLGLAYIGDLGKPYTLRKIAALMERAAASTPHPAVVSGVPPAQPGFAEVRRALLEDEFEPFFQPKRDIQLNRVVGVEVLARWRHPQQGLLGPAAFLPVIEAYGLLDELFWAMFLPSLKFQCSLRQRGIHLPMAFNVHTAQLESQHLVERIRAALAEHWLPPGAITLELTETGEIADLPAAQEALLRLRMLGCKVSMDDFGLGFSSLNRLCELPFNEVKLDAAFIRASDLQPRSVEVIRSAVDMARAMGVELVVEGVETPAQLALLCSLGCRYAQGYLLGRPMAAIDIAAMAELTADVLPELLQQ